MAALEPAHLSVGSLFNGRYQITRCIGKGGMGAVYEVVHRDTERRRALKVMLPSKLKREGLRARFKREATVVAAVESEHIADVLDAGIDGETGSPFIVMELLEGEDLAAMLQRRGTLPAEEVVRLLWQASLALDKTHVAGIVHRDLKPENLFVIERDDGTACMKLLDFGLAKVVTGNSTGKTTKGIVGTLVYLAPEQVHGRDRQSGQTDVYALAQIAYTLLTGTPFWSQAVADQNFYGVLVTVSEGAKQSARERAKEHCEIELPEAFDPWFAKATAIEPGDRHESCAALVSTLAEALGVALPRGAKQPIPKVTSVADRDDSAALESDDSSATSSFAETATRTGRRTLVVMLGVAVLVVGVGVIALNLLEGPAQPPASGAVKTGAVQAGPTASGAVILSASPAASGAPQVSATATATSDVSASPAAPSASPSVRPASPATARPRPSAIRKTWTPPVTER